MRYVALLGLVLVISPILLGEVCWRVPGPFCHAYGGWIAWLGVFSLLPIGIVLILVGLIGTVFSRRKKPSNDNT
jgi:hypothetical protein